MIRGVPGKIAGFSTLGILAPPLRMALPMKWNIALAFVVVAGCAAGTPPFDDLPLRDSLRADPEALSVLPDSARRKLAVRLEAARLGDQSLDLIGAMEALDGSARMLLVDRARERRGGDPLVAGIVDGVSAWPIRESASVAGTSPLPRMEGRSATATAGLEQTSLDHGAGRVIRALLAASGAQRLERVVGWPVGAVAIGDTVFVNAAWLAALAPSGDDPVDGGVPPGGKEGDGGESAEVGGGDPVGATAVPSGTASTAEASRPARVRTGSSGFGYDAGISYPVPSSAPTEPGPDPSAEACVACMDACASSDTNSGDSCDTTDDGSADACASQDPAASDGCDTAASTEDSAEGCKVARGHGRRKGSSSRQAWLAAPLLFLWPRRRT